MAERKLMIQMQQITFLACTVEDLARGESGLQMAKYLQNIKLNILTLTKHALTTHLSQLKATIVRMEA